MDIEIIDFILTSAAFFCGLFSFWKLLFKKNALFEDIDNSNISIKDLPKISIIIPARNEEKSLPGLLNSLKKQTYKNFEIIVVNDNSSDNTGLVAQKYGARLINLENLPKDWLGKNWACWNGAIKADTGYFLFLDSDTILSKNAVKIIVLKHIKNSGAISIQPYHYMKKPYEQFSALFNAVLIGAMNSFSIFSRIIRPIGFFGPCIFCSSGDYFKSGGHEKAKNKVLEDLEIGRNFLRNNIKVNNYVGSGIISFRMYPGGFKSLLHGWSKGFGFGAKISNIFVIIMISLWITGFFTAFINIIRSSINANILYIVLSVILYILYVFLFYLILLKIGNFNFLVSFFYIFPAIFFCIIFVYSLAISFLIKKVVWKNRVISIKKRV